MAYAFGTGVSVAAFFVAFRFANLFRRLLGEGALQTAFIPYFEKLRNEDAQKAGQFFYNLTTLLSLVLMGITVLVVSGIALFLHYGDPSEDNREILLLTAIIQPGLLFICLYGLNSSFLQCEKNYLIPSAAPVAMNGIWILGILSLWNFSAEQAMPWLSVFILAACFGQWAFTIPHTRALLKGFHLKNPWKSVQLFSTDIKKMLVPLFLGMTGVAAEQINSAIDPVFAYYANPEGPALLWFAIRLQQLPLALFGIAIAGALLPPISRAIKTQDFPTYYRFLDFGLQRTVALMIPITGALFMIGESYIALLYGHGDFTSQSIIGTTHCLWGYSLGLLPMTLILVIAPAFYAQNKYSLTTQASLISILTNIALNTFFVVMLDLGAASVALATSLSAWVNMTQLAVALHRQLHVNLSSSLLVNTLKVLTATSIACLAVMALGYYPLAGAFSRSIVDSCGFVAALAAAAWMLKADDLLYIWKSSTPERGSMTPV